MTTERFKRMLTLLATLVAAAAFAAGCGDDNKDSGGGPAGGLDDNTQQSESSPADSAPGSRNEAADRCREEADKLEGQAKETADAACDSIETGDTDRVKEEAKEQCLEGTKQIPDDAQRKAAEDACNKLGD